MEGCGVMTSDEFFTRHLSSTPVIAILRGFNPAEAVDFANTAWEAGIELVEVPIQDDKGRKALEAVAREAQQRGKPCGAGTVLTEADVEFAYALGCVFTVSPGFDPTILKAAQDRNLHHLPGVATPSEVGHAQSLGAIWQKAFPSRELGSTWFNSMKGPFPSVKFVATGGIDATNVSEFLAAGAHAVGIGTAVTDPQTLVAVRQTTGRKESQ
jgi:2-dehydro-3-deoxyphosphogluconate aldolase/(4S)-4-hydroxy-2-oxoglutarate aldolase